MEEHVVAARLVSNRARLRALLVPDPETGRIEADVFPRSAVMRAMFDTRAIRLAKAGMSIALLVKARRAAIRQGIWPMFARSISGLMSGITRH